MKMKKPNGEYCINNLENAEVFKNFYLKQLYNNHEGTKYDGTIMNKIDKQPENSLLGDIPTELVRERQMEAHLLFVDLVKAKY